MRKYLFNSLASLLLSLFIANGAEAQTPETAPEELKNLISSIQEAANNRDLERVMEFYSESFENNDGLRRSSVSDALEQLWKRFEQLTYNTQLESWEEIDDQLVAETITNIEGTNTSSDRTIRLNSTIRSRQYFQDGKLVRQEILSERSELTSGDVQPEIKVILPEEVKVGQQYNFDVIISNPVANEVVLGGAIEEASGSDRYLQPSTFELEVLPGGGIFKLVNAPMLPANRWLSAILIQPDSIFMVTQRVRVVDN